MIVIPDVCAAPRQSRRDKWDPSDPVLRYRAYKDLVRLCVPKRVLDSAPGELTLEFELPIRKSWSKKKQAELVGKPHTLKPDIDNLCKAVLDAMWPDGDSFVWKITASKVWSVRAATTLTIDPRIT